MELKNLIVDRLDSDASQGREAFAYISQHYENQPRIGVCCRDVCLRVSRGDEGTKCLLDRVSFDAPPGTMTAIMGASGSGKSTLLDCLLDLHRPTDGSIVGYGYDAGAGFCAYVKQHQAFFSRLTVRETLQHSMAIQLHSTPSEQRHTWLRHLLHLLSLTECQDTRVQVISGGEQRRLAIGLELIQLPSVLVLDEPTSGLDSTNAELLLERLQQFARAGCTIIMAIHQSSSAMYARFDHIVLMRNKASVCFAGTRDQATRMALAMSAHSPSVPHSIPELLVSMAGNVNLQPTHSAQCTQAHNDAAALRTRQPTAWWRPCLALLRRNLLNQARDPHVFMTRVLIYGLLAMLVILLFNDLRNEPDDLERRVRALYFFSSTVVALTIACMPAMMQERAVYLQETQNGHYSPLSYVLMTSVANLPYLLVRLKRRWALCLRRWRLRAPPTLLTCRTCRF
jgi:ABC-type multidrug transport system ATPase subunit